MVHFGWPLLVNGLLMFGIFQGDRFVIASARSLFGTDYTMADLGAYSVAFMLAAAPTLMVANTNALLSLPVLAAAQTPQAFARRYDLAVRSLSLISAVIGAGLILLGGPLTRLLFGPGYEGAAAVIGWLGAMQAIRLVRAAPSMAAMARGDTLNMLWANVARSLALPAMLLAAASGAAIVWIAIAAAAGELVALLVATARLRARHALLMSRTLAAAALMAAALAAAAALESLSDDSLIASAAAWLGLCLLVVGAGAVFFPDLRRASCAGLRELRPAAALAGEGMQP
jgi:O-antigen/teichoic acid export membrane protein